MINSDISEYFLKQYKEFLCQNKGDMLEGSDLVLRNTFERLLTGKDINQNIINNVKRELPNLEKGKWYRIKKDGSIWSTN